MSRPGEPCIEGHPKITGGIDPFDWLPEELNWSGFRDTPSGLSEEHRRDLKDIDDEPSFSPPLLCVIEISQGI